MGLILILCYIVIALGSYKVLCKVCGKPEDEFLFHILISPFILAWLTISVFYLVRSGKF